MAVHELAKSSLMHIYRKNFLQTMSPQNELILHALYQQQAAREAEQAQEEQQRQQDQPLRGAEGGDQSPPRGQFPQAYDVRDKDKLSPQKPLIRRRQSTPHPREEEEYNNY